MPFAVDQNHTLDLFLRECDAESFAASLCHRLFECEQIEFGLKSMEADKVEVTWRGAAKRSRELPADFNEPLKLLQSLYTLFVPRNAVGERILAFRHYDENLVCEQNCIEQILRGPDTLSDGVAGTRDVSEAGGNLGVCSLRER